MDRGVKTLLVVSNGHGEDIIAATVIKEILEIDPGIWIEVVPLVGEGRVFGGLPVRILGQRLDMPSGGFARQSLKMFWEDLKAGLVSLTVHQWKTIKRAGVDADLCLVVGDVYALMMGSRAGCPVVFMPTAKSEYISGHFRFEKKLMKKRARKVFPRDKLTAQDLRTNGVPAEYLGNVMMDTFHISGDSLFSDEAEAVVGILPGSRDEAYDNMMEILKAVEIMEGLANKDLSYGVALASRLDFQQLSCRARERGWELKGPRCIRGHLGRLMKGTAEVHFFQGRFGDLLDQADVFIGLAGTANEQAAGMGKPVVAFPGRGAQFNKKFLRAQKRLLGDALSAVEPEPEQVATEVLVILNDARRYEEMARAGRERMGEPGGAKKIAGEIASILDEVFED